MAEAVDIDILLAQKENMLALPSGRSARQMTEQYSNDGNATIRIEYEKKIAQIDEADDPLDVYDQYIKWTLNAYPSAQTSQSGLLPLLERATKAFQNSAHYKNDSRYLKLWLTYIRLFSDAPREVFVFLARHEIGGELALFYEEFAAWLENAGRWNQAEEVYHMGLEKNARPHERLVRKSAEFSRRKANQQTINTEPSSPVIPTARPALAAKLDPFASTVSSQQSIPTGKKATRPKMQIFADGEEAKPQHLGASNGWENIGTVEERRKENKIAARPMAGEKLKIGKTNGGMQKMMIFRDTSSWRPQGSDTRKQCVHNSSNGRLECVYVDLEAVYPAGRRMEYCFEELRAQRRASSQATNWREASSSGDQYNVSQTEVQHQKKKKSPFMIFQDGGVEEAAKQRSSQSAPLHDALASEDSENIRPDQHVTAKAIRREEKANRTRKINIVDVKHIKNETQTIQLNMESPSKTKPKRKKSNGRVDATVTINTKEAMDEIYGIFSQPLASGNGTNENDEESDTCSTDDESDDTQCLSGRTSEYGEDTKSELVLTKQYDSFNMTEQSIMDQQDPDLEALNATATLPYTISTNYDVEASTNDQLQHIPIRDSDPYHGRMETMIPAHRLPYMTPIAEATESSLGTLTSHNRRELLSTRTPSRQTGKASQLIADDELLSSPFQDIAVDTEILQPIRTKSTKGTISLGHGTINKQMAVCPRIQHSESEAIVADMQCNPMDSQLRANILSKLNPTLHGLRKHEEQSHKTTEIQRWLKSISKGAPSTPIPVIKLDNTQYTIKRELGAGTFAPVYLVQNDVETEECQYEAIKMEDPPSIWEYFILDTTHRKLESMRSAASIVRAREMHVYQDECFLIEQYRDQGTLLDLVNICRSDGAGMDEALAMFFTVELLRVVEALHANKLIHGDLKGDNMMVRFDDPGQETDWSPTYFRSGSHGWSSKGLCLIDFGRGIDMAHFQPEVAFVADWKTTDADCIEMRELRPWTYQIDYYGLAGTIHSMLFGKYMDTMCEKNDGLGRGTSKVYRVRESLKRYWQIELWNEVFHLLLNPLLHVSNEANCSMPVVNGMRQCRERMEDWLEENSEKGAGLKNTITKLENMLKERKRKKT